jgi:hypothetical protein
VADVLVADWQGDRPTTAIDPSSSMNITKPTFDVGSSPVKALNASLTVAWPPY